MKGTEKKNMLVPQLRFKGFDDVLEIKKGSDLFINSRIKGNDKLPIYSVTLDRGMVPRDSLDRRMGNDAEAGDNLLVLENDISYNMMRMWQGAFGLAPTDCMVSPAYVVLHPKENVFTDFFISCFSRSRNLYLFTAYSYGLTSDRLRLYFKDFAQIKFVVPTLPEQQKIATFLSAVDEKIQLLTRKKALLEQYKKGVMQRLFSGELRFKPALSGVEGRDEGKGFPEWEEKRLGEISEKKSSNIAANAISENVGDYKIYGATGFLKNVDFYREEEPYISIVKDGAGVGRTLLCDAKTSVLGTLDIIKPTINVDLYFLYSVLDNIDFVKYTKGSTIPHIYFKDYSTEKIQLPHLAEQQKIANFLSNLDNKIESVTEQITQTQTFKKGLLQQMFV